VDQNQRRLVAGVDRLGTRATPWLLGVAAVLVGLHTVLYLVAEVLQGRAEWSTVYASAVLVPLIYLIAGGLWWLAYKAWGSRLDAWAGERWSRMTRSLTDYGLEGVLLPGLLALFYWPLGAITQNRLLLGAAALATGYAGKVAWPVLHRAWTADMVRNTTDVDTTPRDPYT
jgi:hypothetical protein